MDLDLDALRARLRRTDTDDLRELYLAWGLVLPRVNGSAILPLVAEAFAVTKQARGRESQVYHATLFSRFDERAVELGLRALSDRKKEVRARACMLLAHSRRTEVVPALRAVGAGPTRAMARRAVTSLLEGTPFVPGDDPLYFFFRGDEGRAPRGVFADDVDREIGPWLRKRGFAPAYLFGHSIAWGREDTRIAAEWHGYEVEARVTLSGAARARVDETVGGGPGDIAAVARQMRTLLDG